MQDKRTLKGFRLKNSTIDFIEQKSTEDNRGLSQTLDVIVEEYKKLPRRKTTNKESKPIEERREQFIQEVATFKEHYQDDMLKEFFLYWSEPNKTKTKMRFELQKTFDVQRRLLTWAKNNKNFKNDKPTSRNKGWTSEDYEGY